MKCDGVAEPSSKSYYSLRTASGGKKDERMSDIQKEVDQNFEVFRKELPNLASHHGKYALMRHGKIINFYDTLQDAYSTGAAIYDDKIFSVQLVTNQPIDLGFLSHAVHSG